MMMARTTFFCMVLILFSLKLFATDEVLGVCSSEPTYEIGNNKPVNAIVKDTQKIYMIQDIHALIKIMNDSNLDIQERVDAINKLAQIDDSLAVNALIEFSKKEKIGLLQRPVVKGLIQVFQRNPEEKLMSAFQWILTNYSGSDYHKLISNALAENGSNDAVKVLKESLHKLKYKEGGPSLLSALKRIGTTNAMEAISEKMYEPEVVEWARGEYLQYLNPEYLIKALKYQSDTYHSIPYHALRALSDLDDSQMNMKVEGYSTVARNLGSAQYIRDGAIKGLLEVNVDNSLKAETLAFSALNDPSDRIRYEAIASLDRDAYPNLIGLYHQVIKKDPEDSYSIRSMVLDKLKLIDELPVVDPLVTAGINRHWSIHNSARSELLRRDAPEITEKLVEILMSEFGSARANFVTSILIDKPGQEAQDALFQSVQRKDWDHEYRENAFRYLISVKDERIIDLSHNILQDQDEEKFYRLAINSLNMILEEAQAITTLLEYSNNESSNSDIKRYSLVILATKNESRAIRASLNAIANSPDRETRQQVFSSFSQQMIPEVIDATVSLFSNNDNLEWSRITAINLVARKAENSNSKKVLDALNRIIQDEPVGSQLYERAKYAHDKVSAP